MSADFWAGYLSGAIGILIGNPLDLIKVRLQARDAIVVQSAASYARQFQSAKALATGTAAPVLGYGALNALLFVSYNRTDALLSKLFATQGNLWSTWTAGAVAGLATWVVSTPTELIKCRAQLSSSPQSSWHITRRIWGAEGILAAWSPLCVIVLATASISGPTNSARDGWLNETLLAHSRHFNKTLPACYSVADWPVSLRGQVYSP
jgi:hypothetical protein